MIHKTPYKFFITILIQIDTKILNKGTTTINLAISSKKGEKNMTNLDFSNNPPTSIDSQNGQAFIIPTNKTCNNEVTSNVSSNLPLNPNDYVNFCNAETIAILTENNTNLTKQYNDVINQNHALQSELYKKETLLKQKNMNFTSTNWFIERKNGSLFANNGRNTVNICNDFITNIIKIINMDVTNNLPETLYFIATNDCKDGYTYILNREMYTKKILDKLQSASKQMINPEGIPLSKLSVAFSLFIDANVNEKIHFYGINGWHEKKYFATPKNCALFNQLNILSKQRLDIFNKSLIDVNTTDSKVIRLDYGLDAITYMTPITSLLYEAGYTNIPLILIQHNEHSNTFIKKQLTLFDHYQTVCDLNLKRDVESALRHSADEPMIMNYFNPNTSGRQNLYDLITSIEMDRDFHNIPIKVIPIIYTDNIYNILDKYNITCIPVILESAINYSCNILSQMSAYIKWCEQNYDEIINLISSINKDTENSITKFFKIAFCLQYFFEHGCFGTAINHLYHNKDNKDITVITQHAIEIGNYYQILSCFSTYNFKNKFNSAIFKIKLKKNNINGKNILEYYEGNTNNYYYYTTKGDCYMTHKVFNKICNLMYLPNHKTILEKLAADNVIEVEKNGYDTKRNKKITYSSSSNPTNQRMIHFYPDKLIDSNSSIILDNMFTTGIYIGKNESNKKLYIPMKIEIIKKMPNMNICLWGTPGYGKSFMLKRLSASAVKSNIPVLYIDYSMDISKEDFHLSKSRFYNIDEFLNMIPSIISEEDFDKLPSFLVKSLSKQSNNKNWEDLFYKDAPAIHIIQFSDNYTSSNKMLLSEVILKAFTDWLCSNQKLTYPNSIMVVLDEVQNLKIDETSPLYKLLRQGRGHGCITVTATQSLKGLKSLDLFLGASYQFFFRLDPKSKGTLEYYVNRHAFPNDFKDKGYLNQVCQLGQHQFIAKGIWNKDKIDRTFLIDNSTLMN